MTPECKSLLIRTIDEFKLTQLSERQSKIDIVKKRLKTVNSPNSFFEPAAHIVVAASLFLRIADRIPFN